jgi:DNA-binding NtrC family response regulator
VLLANEAEIEAAAIELDAPRSSTGNEAAAATPVGRKMEEVERDYILQTLQHTLGNRTHAATILGISIRALRNKLRDYSAQGMAVPPPVAGIMA